MAGVLYAGGKLAVGGGRVLLVKYRARQIAANNAKDQLKAESEKEVFNSGEVIGDEVAGPSGAGEETQP